MRPDRGDERFLWDMLETAREAMGYVQGRTWEDFTHEGILRRAVRRVVEIIGEASRNVSPDFKKTHPEVPWSKIAGTRHRLAHDYDLIDDATIWNIATVYVPELIVLLEPLALAPPRDPEPGSPPDTAGP